MKADKKHKWVFPIRFRVNAYGWNAAKLASQRLREAVSEIKKVVKKEPQLGGGSMKDKVEVLTDLIKTTQGEEGKWFAMAKGIQLYDLDLERVSTSPCEPKILTRQETMWTRN